MACSLLLPCEIHWYELGLNPRVAKFVNRERGLAVWVFDFVHFIILLIKLKIYRI